MPKPSPCEAKKSKAKAPGSHFIGPKILASCQPAYVCESAAFDDPRAETHMARLGGQKLQAPNKTFSSGP
jgi:hypothetical protein